LNTVVQKVVEGIFSRVERGTWMGHVIEHIALEIQTLAGMDTGFETRDQNTWDLQCCFQLYRRTLAAESAVAIAESLIAETEYDLESDLQIRTCSLRT
jgi:cyanophycin synthetase